MNCIELNTQLDDICSKALSKEVMREAEEHLATCYRCSEALAEHKQYLTMMQQFSSPELEAGKGARMLRNAAQSSEGALESPHGFAKGFIAASILFVCMLTGWNLMPEYGSSPVVAQQTHYISTDVNLVIYVPQDMPNADLNLLLPDAVLLAGFEGDRELTWSVDLKQGANTLSLPIKVPSDINLNKGLHFIAKINFNNKEKQFDLNVNLPVTTSKA